MPKYFDSGNRLRMDSCAVQARNAENESVSAHCLTNYHQPVCSRGKEAVHDFMIENPNLRITDGYGVNGCIIDRESAILQSKLVQPRQRKQLTVREFLAVPDLSRGGCAPGLESQLQQGSDTTVHKVCDKFSSSDFARLMPPSNKCWYTPNTVGPVPANSKDIMKSHDSVCDARKARAAHHHVNAAA